MWKSFAETIRKFWCFSSMLVSAVWAEWNCIVGLLKSSLFHLNCPSRITILTSDSILQWYFLSCTEVLVCPCCAISVKRDLEHLSFLVRGKIECFTLFQGISDLKLVLEDLFHCLFYLDSAIRTIQEYMFSAL